MDRAFVKSGDKYLHVKFKNGKYIASWGNTLDFDDKSLSWFSTSESGLMQYCKDYRLVLESYPSETKNLFNIDDL